jgi:hypothetical protein
MEQAMLKNIVGALIAFALIAAPAAAGEKKRPRPHLTAQVLDAMQVTQENLARLKIRSLRIPNPRFAAKAIAVLPRG